MTQRLLLWAILLGLLLCDCRPTAEATNTPSSDHSIHLIVAVQGQLGVKRESWSKYVPARFGTTLQHGDLLRLEGSSQATVACADVTIVAVPRGIGGIPCKVAQPLLVYAGSLVNPTRGNTSGEFPMVVLPRQTKLLNARPMLRWTPVTGATTYTVSVRGPNVQWSMDVSTKTAVVYPDSAPALTAGAAYKVTVVAAGRSSDEESGPGLGFTLLKPDEAQMVREAERKLRALGLADTPTQFLVAYLYLAHGLNAGAIELLEELSSVLQEPAAVRLLGETYVKIGLSRLAEDRYLRALKLSQGVQDVEGEALAQNALGLIYAEALGNKGEAGQRLQKAMALYQRLGDAKMVRQLRGQLAGLQ